MEGEVRNENFKVDASSLVDLKAELFRKQQALKEAKLHRDNVPLKKTAFRLKGEESTSNEKTKLTPATVTPDHEEMIALQKSRFALEAKARLYDEIMKNGECENETFLVNFHEKIIEKGRTNKQTEVQKAADEIAGHERVSSELPSTQQCNSNCSSSSMKQTKESVESHSADVSHDDKGEIHYQNVQFNEVRDHGVGYFAFSEDQRKRSEEMSTLNTLREQTKKKRMAHGELQQHKKKSLEARLSKICERRRINKDVISEYTSLKMGNSENASSISEGQSQPNVELDTIPLPDEKHEQPAEEKKVRPWDVGKNFWDSNIRTQATKNPSCSWLEEQRAERNEEFAPPSSYT